MWCISKISRKIILVFFLSSHPYAIWNADSTTGTPAISTTTTVEIRKSSVMTTEITSKVEKSPTTATGNSSCPSTETEEEKAKRLLYCSLCKVAVNSASQLEAHNSGEMLWFLFCLNQQLCNYLFFLNRLDLLQQGTKGVAENWQLLHGIH